MKTRQTPCSLIGILDDGWAGLSDAARQRIETARVVIGGKMLRQA